MNQQLKRFHTILKKRKKENIRDVTLMVVDEI